MRHSFSCYLNVVFCFHIFLATNLSNQNLNTVNLYSLQTVTVMVAKALLTQSLQLTRDRFATKNRRGRGEVAKVATSFFLKSPTGRRLKSIAGSLSFELAQKTGRDSVISVAKRFQRSRLVGDQSATGRRSVRSATITVFLFGDRSPTSRRLIADRPATGRRLIGD